MFTLLFSPLTPKKTQSGQSTNEGRPEGRGGARDFRGLRLIRELDVVFVFSPVFWGASYTQVRLICAILQ